MKYLVVVILCFIATGSSFGQDADTIKQVTITLDCRIKPLGPDRQPLYIFQYGEEKVLVQKDMITALGGDITPEKINVIKSEEERVLYGEAAKNGVILIVLSEELVKRKEWNKIKKSHQH
jgi:hypothetical protein